RLVEEGFGESIPAVVIRVYSTSLTVPGEVSLRSSTHLEPLPKTLTSPVSRQVQGILTGRGLQKTDLFFNLPRTGAIRSRIFSPQKNFREFWLHARCEQSALALNHWHGRASVDSSG
ncbi:hypothetical protein PQQ86_38135, partial [Paraburkholderia sediminicola]|uniref:hypothetical protein n=1 Tax=Paraburkholderia sediminicola TaxID=458836 RepID=UPI0038BA3281